MGPSHSQLKLLSPEERILYKRWLSRGLLLYGSLMAFLIFAVVANHTVRTSPSDVAGDIHTAVVSARK
jgi:hypothetical protein